MDLSTGARKPGCIFCDIVAGVSPAVIVSEGYSHIAIIPRNPFTLGHLLFLPRVHVEGPAESPALTGRITEMAAKYAQKDWADYENFNLIMSEGKAATQTVHHLHIHLIPRFRDDESGWPWYGPPPYGFQKSLTRTRRQRGREKSVGGLWGLT